MLATTETPEVEVVTPIAYETGYLVQDEAIINELVRLINQERSNAQLNTLEIDTTLTKCAEVRAMEASNTWSHLRPDGTPWHTVLKGTYRGENLGRGYNTAEEMFNAWMASPGHKANMLESRFAACGVAIYKIEKGYVWCIGFGT